MSVPGASSKHDWHALTLGSIPIRFSPWFAVIGLLVVTREGTLLGGLATLAMVTGAVLVHELGHALAARRYGLAPKILLHGAGGWCEHDPPYNRREHISVVAGGPVAGLGLSAVAGIASLVLGEQIPPQVAPWIQGLVWWNTLINLVNLLPVLPLDGGSLFLLWLQGRRTERPERRARRVGTVVAGVAAVGAVALGSLFIGILFAVLAWQNAAAAGWVPSAPQQAPTREAGYSRPRSAPRQADVWPSRRVAIGAAVVLSAAAIPLTLVQGATATQVVAALWVDPAALASGQLWRLVTWPFVDAPGDLFRPVASALGVGLMLPVLQRAWGRALWGVVAVAVPLLGLLAAAIASLTSGVLMGAVPLVFGVLGAWTVLVDRRLLAQVLPVPVAPELIALVLIVIGVSGAWQAAAWVDLGVSAAALGLGWSLARFDGWQRPWRAAGDWWALRNPPPIEIDSKSPEGTRPPS